MSQFSHCFGLLAFLIICILAWTSNNYYVTALALPAATQAPSQTPTAHPSPPTPATAAPPVLVKRSANTSQSATAMATTVGSESFLFKLPIQIDEDDLLEEYGRFLVGNMNQSVDPCHDFYQYACGNWSHSELVAPKLRNDTFLHAMQGKIDELMNNFLSNTTDADLKGTSAEAKAKTFYYSCVQMNQNMEIGYKAVLEMEEFSGKLNSKTDNNETIDWMNVNFLSRYAMFALMPMKAQYSTDSRKFEIILSKPIVVLGKPELVNVKNLTRDFKLDTEEKQKKFTADLETMIELEKNITFHASTRNKTEVLSLKDFLIAHKDDTMNWTRYFDIAFNGTARDEWIVHNTVDGVEGIIRFLEKADLNLLRDYIQWRTLIKFYFIWKAEVSDKNIASTCREHTENYFNYALMPWFIDTVYDEDRRADVLEIAKKVKLQFYDLIDRYTWLDDETKSNARTKLNSMDIEVGYKDDLKYREEVDQIYGSINMSATDWFRNLQVLEANRARVRLKSIDKSLIPPLMSTLNVNAYYADFLNLAFFAIGISQLPFYHIKFPPSLKYGGMAHIIGHEMAHGFDSYCYQFNYDGKKQNWWSEAALRNFRERYRCLESQYNKYIYRGVPTNGTQTSGDNIADNVGTRMAYFAYMNNYGSKDAEKKPIRQLQFTNKQLFFLKFAQTWCTGKDDSYKMRKIKTDTHAYEEFRVMGTLSNMPEFSEAFQCKLGSNMNPVKKCVVW